MTFVGKLRQALKGNALLFISQHKKENKDQRMTNIYRLLKKLRFLSCEKKTYPTHEYCDRDKLVG